MTSSRLRCFLRLCVSIALLGALLAFVPLGQLWSALRGVSPLLWLGALLVVLLGHVLAASKWWLLLARHDKVPFRLALQAHFTGLSTNLCLPGIAGGDVVRAAYVMKQGDNRTGLGVASVADRLIDCAALLLLAGAGALWTAKLHGLIGQALAGAAAVATVALVVTAVVYWRLRSSRHALAGRIAEALTVLIRHPWLMMRCLLISLLIQGGFVALNACIGSAAGVEAPAAAWLVAWPLAKLAAVAPISLGGLGVRESALIVFLRPFGATPATVMAAGVLWQTLLIAGGLVRVLALWAPAPAKGTVPVISEVPSTFSASPQEASIS
jgi:uncharacterized membrane protein YbhN (UPF0104 family)